MSAPKQFAKRQKLARKRQRKHQRERRNQRKERFLSQPDFGGPSVDFDAPGGIKMSEILDEFVEPFMHLVDGEEALRKLLTLGVVAWNAALGPEARQQEMVDDVIRKGLRGESEETQAACREIVNQLVARKHKFFAAYRRPIINFVLEHRSDGYHLLVLSELR
jgi:hypothetical protein